MIILFMLPDLLKTFGKTIYIFLFIQVLLQRANPASNIITTVGLLVGIYLLGPDLELMMSFGVRGDNAYQTLVPYLFFSFIGPLTYWQPIVWARGQARRFAHYVGGPPPPPGPPGPGAPPGPPFGNNNVGYNGGNGGNGNNGGSGGKGGGYGGGYGGDLGWNSRRNNGCGDNADGGDYGTGIADRQLIRLALGVPTHTSVGTLTDHEEASPRTPCLRLRETLQHDSRAAQNLTSPRESARAQRRTAILTRSQRRLVAEEKQNQ